MSSCIHNFYWLKSSACNFIAKHWKHFIGISSAVYLFLFSFSHQISTANTGIKIQFFGEKQDALRVQESIQKMVDRGRIGNVTLVPSSLVIRDEAVLQIEVCYI